MMTSPGCIVELSKIFALSTTPTVKPARSYSSSGIMPGCSAVSPPTREQPAWTQPSAMPLTISAIFSGMFLPQAM